jgi:hypothetical protein
MVSRSSTFSKSRLRPLGMAYAMVAIGGIGFVKRGHMYTVGMSSAVHTVQNPGHHGDHQFPRG